MTKFKKVLLLLYAFTFFACKNDIEVVNKLTASNNLPQLKAENMEITYSDSGFVKLKTFTPLLESYTQASKPYSEFKQGIKTVSYDRFQKVTSEMSAKYAIYLINENLWELKSNVVVKNINGETLTTEHLFFQEDKEILYTKEFVMILNANGSKITGKGGFESNLGFTEYRFVDVSGKYNFNNN
jgi:LPS export ABC transporter protein LptC